MTSEELQALVAEVDRLRIIEMHLQKFLGSERQRVDAGAAAEAEGC